LAAYLPEAHGLHDEAFPLLIEPAGQALQLVAVLDEAIVPGGQGWQSVAPGEEEKYPAPQFLQEPATPYCPAGHKVQLADPELLILPRGHGVHEADPAVE